jgi:hypothetical protein
MNTNRWHSGFSPAAGLVFGAASPHAADVPCEQLIKRLDDALKGSQVSGVEMAKAIVLRRRGSDQCRAQKYSVADRHLGEALKNESKPVGLQAIYRNRQQISYRPIVAVTIAAITLTASVALHSLKPNIFPCCTEGLQ